MSDAPDDALRAFLLDQRADEDDTALRRYLGADTRPVPSDDLVRALLPPSRPATSLDWKAARRDADAWFRLGFSADDVRAWLRAGLDGGDAELADELVTEGIDPVRAGEVVDDPDTAEPLPIWELGRRHFDVRRPGSLSRVLDDAGVERDRLARAPQWMRRWGFGS